MIEINNLTTTPVDEEFLKEISQKVLIGEEKKDSDLSIALVGQGRMRTLNKKYRGKNRVTDVLAFGENSTPTHFQWIKLPSHYSRTGTKLKSLQSLGEIVICLREVKKNTKRYGSVFQKELAKVLIHGILHLLGYDHDKNKETAKLMEEKEQYYLSRVFSE